MHVDQLQFKDLHSIQLSNKNSSFDLGNFVLSSDKNWFEVCHCSEELLFR